MKIGSYNIGIKSLAVSTPPIIRLFGDSLATAAVAAAGLIATTNPGNTKLAIIIVVAGFIGKLLGSFFGPKDTTTQVINSPNSEPIVATVASTSDGTKTIV